MRQRIGTVICGILIVILAGCGKPDIVYLEDSTETARQKSADEDRRLLTAAEEDSGEQRSSDTSEPEEVTENVPEKLYVHICGAVLHPGVYELPAGSRIFEAVELAGGLREDACEESVNQAELLSDGKMVRILTEEEAQQQTARQDDADGKDSRVNINTADAAELMTLPGIGSSKADSILSYREEHGGFQAAEELMNITGIKEGVYARIKDYITVD